MGNTRSKDNILLVANYSSDVGFAWWLMENFWVEVARRFDQLGRESFLIYPRVTKIPKGIKESSIQILEHDFEDRSLRGLRSLKSIIKERRIAYVYLTDKRGYDWLYGALRMWGVRVIVDHSHYYVKEAPAARSVVRQWIKRYIYSSGVISCDHYIGVSRYIGDRMTVDWGIPAQRVAVIMNGIVPIETDSADATYAQRAFNIPLDGVIVVSTGRVTRHKGVDLLIGAARTIVESGDDRTHFLYLGDGPDLESSRNMVEAYGLQRRFYLPGRRDDVRGMLPSCHIGVQMSQGEGFSLSLLEYLSSGLATIASDVGGNSEAIIPGKTGMLVPVGDQKALTEGIQMLVGNEAYREELGLAARESVLKGFNIERTNRELITLLNGICGT